LVKIRLKRFGTRNNPHYRIVVTDVRRAREGAYIESLGSFDPRGTQTLTLDETRLEYWLGKGAHMTPRVKALRKHIAIGGKAPLEGASGVETSVKPEPLSKEKDKPLEIEDTEEETNEEASTEGGKDEGSA